MGLRFNKSIRIGKNFRINLSKSGVGYSYGVKGYRITKTAKGNIRHTANIPNTGISYVKEHNPNKNNSSNEKPPNKSIVKIVLLCILSLLLLPFVPAIVVTILLKKSRLKKSNKIIFIALSWILNLFLIGFTASEPPNPNETIPVITLNKDSSTSSTENTTEAVSESTSEISTIASNVETSNITSEEVTIETATSVTETISKEVVTTQATIQQTTIIETTTQQPTTVETTIQPTTKEIITEKQTQPTTKTNKELTTNNVYIKTLYVGNKSNGKLHRSDCRHTKKLLPENIAQFDSKDSAISAGYTDLCAVCNP